MWFDISCVRVSVIKLWHPVRFCTTTTDNDEYAESKQIFLYLFLSAVYVQDNKCIQYSSIILLLIFSSTLI